MFGRRRAKGPDPTFEEQGYVVLPGLLTDKVIAEIDREAHEFYAREGVEPERADRTMNFHQQSAALREVLNGRALTDALRRLMGAEPFFLQSIFFNTGSQQAAHSDYIYMSTNPPMQLCGVWFALEDVKPDAGPLMYFPGSQTMPMPGIRAFWEQSSETLEQVLARDGEALQAKYAARMAQTGEALETCIFYDMWLDRISTYVSGAGVPMRTFTAKKGDVLVWHANLVHGGTAIVDQALTRRSIVAHYLTQDVDQYYDMNFLKTQAVLCLGDIDASRPAVLQVRA